MSDEEKVTDHSRESADNNCMTCAFNGGRCSGYNCVAGHRSVTRDNKQNIANYFGGAHIPRGR
ncbi:hypothetical protein COB18_01070 [Candidatus Kaiserbacteria bacterium]|nr:MAG: hypothetical protein COB18_01070 [Candidatus Kaiserbacteria bacterium]